ncbi:hypothetical protein OH77DRAFT_752752 [Trametes cingulata]|nr:hypothetical protein OH77DRAFT_752752 [Trametes cingulata]
MTRLAKVSVPSKSLGSPDVLARLASSIEPSEDGRCLIVRGAASPRRHSSVPPSERRQPSSLVLHSGDRHGMHPPPDSQGQHRSPSVERSAYSTPGRRAHSFRTDPYTNVFTSKPAKQGRDTASAHGRRGRDRTQTSVEAFTVRIFAPPPCMHAQRSPQNALRHRDANHANPAILPFQPGSEGRRVGLSECRNVGAESTYVPLLPGSASSNARTRSTRDPNRDSGLGAWARIAGASPPSCASPARPRRPVPRAVREKLLIRGRVGRWLCHPSSLHLYDPARGLNRILVFGTGVRALPPSPYPACAPRRPSAAASRDPRCSKAFSA